LHLGRRGKEGNRQRKPNLFLDTPLSHITRPQRIIWTQGRGDSCSSSQGTHYARWHHPEKYLSKCPEKSPCILSPPKERR
ncbi:unnamed protein product, partial [Coregonus sp. 'balchen']